MKLSREAIKRICFLTIPIVLSSPLLFPNVTLGGNSSAARSLFVTIIVASYWITEVLPIPATALLPSVLFPILGVLESDDVTSAYMNDNIFLFLGSFITAFAMERWNLHKRIALRLLLLAGDRPKGLLWGFMAITGFLSMWMSNTSTTSIMGPLVVNTLKQLEAGSNRNSKDQEAELGLEKDEIQLVELQEENDISREQGSISDEIKLSEESLISNPQDISHEHVKAYAKITLISVAYSASIGGTATIIGTGPNIILKSQFKILFPKAPEISFATWSLFAMPLAWIFLFLLWLGFTKIYLRNATQIRFPMQLIKEQYEQLGPISFAEGVIAVNICIMSFLWFTRVGFGDSLPGWGIWFGGKVGDGTIAMMMGVLLFVIPSRSADHSRPFIIDWESLRDLPWGVLLLLGSGFALARAFAVSGLSEWIGESLVILDKLPVSILLFCICTFLVFATEFTSNVAIANISIPILASIAKHLGLNPLMLLVPATIAVSFAFMFPVATPPNAMVFAFGYLKVPDMVKTGIFANAIGVLLLPIWMLLIGVHVFGIDMDHLPSWAT